MESSEAAELTEPYLLHLTVERKLAQNTVTSYRRDLKVLAQFVAADPAAPKLQNLETRHIRRYAAQLHARGLSGRAIARALSGWRTFYDWLAAREAIGSNPVNDVRAPKSGKRLPKALAPELAVRLVSAEFGHAPSDLRDQAIFELFYSSGLRLSELVGLDVTYFGAADYRSSGWIDLDSADVTVTGKGKKKRTVPIGAPAVAALRAWLARRAEWLASDPRPLFLSAKGKRLSGRTIQHRLKSHARKLGIPANVHPHVLRHSFASHLLQSSSDLRAVQELLGHSSIAATQVYTSLDFQRLASVYDVAHPRARKMPGPR